jgi:hypothetical protein
MGTMKGMRHAFAALMFIIFGANVWYFYQTYKMRERVLADDQRVKEGAVMIGNIARAYKAQGCEPLHVDPNSF